MDINNNKKDPVNLIGISGKMGSGKDLVGQIIQYLCDKNESGYNYSLTNKKEFNLLDDYVGYIKRKLFSNWEIRKFADKLKDVVCLLIGCTREQLEDREFKEKELGEEWWYYKVKYDDFDFYGEEVFINLKDAEEFYEKLKTDGYYANVYKPILIKLTPRKLLQLLGTECGRNIIHPNIWVNALFANYIPDEGYFYEVRPTGNIGFSGNIELKILSNPERYNKGYPNWLITDIRFPNEAEAIKNRNGIVIRVNRYPRAVINNVEYIVGTDGGLTEHESETTLDNYQFDYVIDNNGTIEELVEKVKEILIKEQIISYET